MIGEDERAVRETIQAFYDAFNEGFNDPADYATDDWHHINPFGGQDRSKQATLATVRAVHGSFLAGATDTIQSMDIRFATADVAVGTVISELSAITLPSGDRQERTQQVRTFVVVKGPRGWRIMQDHNTAITG